MKPKHLRKEPDILEPPQRFDEELGKAEFRDLHRTRRATAGCGLAVAVVVLTAGVLWFLLKGLPAIRRRQQALAADSWEPPTPTPFVRGIDYDVPESESDDE